jgi:hypothetical protein
VEFAAIVWAFAIVGVIVRFTRRRRILSRLEANLRQLRTLAIQPLRYRRIDTPGRDLGELERVTPALRARDLTILGDAIEELAGQRATRWFVDTAGTVFGWLGIIPVRGRMEPVVALVSASAERSVLTVCAPVATPGLAQPPFVDRAAIRGPLDLAAALSAHRARMPDAAVSATTLDEAIAVVDRVRARTIAWREAQAPAELVENDLRAILGKHYPRFGPPLQHRLAPEIPVARVHT